MKPALPLILPVENQVREFDAKLLLGCFAAERGIPAFVGCHARIGERMHDFPRSVYVAKAVSPGSGKLFRIVQKLGHGLAAWDEEALVYMSPTFYLRRKVGAQSLSMPDALLAWGDDNAEIWRGAAGYRGQPLRVTGNPRGDLLRPDMRALHEVEAEAWRKKFGKFVLINSNFGGLNLYFSELNRARLDRMHETSVEEEKVGTWEDPGMIRFRWRLFEEFQQMLDGIATRMPHLRFVMRPHPSENPEVWQNIAARHSNISVVGEGSIIPWLLSASVVIQNGCTTGLESFLLGRPVIAYKPIVDPIYDMELPNRLSEVAGDVDSLAASIETLMTHGPALGNEREELASRHIAAREGRFASERIVDAYQEMSSDEVFADTTPLRQKIVGQFASRRRGLKKAIRSMKPGNFDSADFVRYRFPDRTEAEVRQRVQSLSNIMDRFANVRVRQRSRNIFALEAA